MIVMLALALASCGGGASSSVSASSAVTVAVTPATTAITTGATQPFVATVNGATNPSVSWSVNSVKGGNATVGTVSASGVYTAPASAPSSAVTVTATSTTDRSKSGSATVSVKGHSGSGSVSVSVTPSTAAIQAGATQQFGESVNGSSNTAVTWKVNGVGSVSSAGLYQAPASVSTSTTVSVIATSNADNTKSASANVTVLPNGGGVVSVSISPTSSSVSAGKSQQFAATISGTSNTTATWQVNGVTGGNSMVGTISTSGLYTAPSSSSNVTVTARSYYDSSKYANASVAVTGSSYTPPSSSGPAYYVSPSGSDSNSGSASSPFLTIQHAADVVTSGYTVHVAPGTYNVNLIDTSKSGTSSSHIVFVSDQQWGAKIVVSSAVNGDGWANTGSYVDIVGFDISATDTSANALLHMGGTYDRVLGNRVHDMAAPSGSCPSGGAIDLGGNVNYHTAIGNVVFNAGPPPSAYCNQTQGIYINTSYNLVENNVVFNNGGIGIQIWGPGSTGNVVTNNTVFGNLRGIVIGSESSTVASGNIVANNIFYNNLQQGVYDESGTTGSNTIANNLIYGNSPNTSLTTDTAVNTISTAPKFVNYTGNSSGNYQEAGGSPSIGAGSASYAPALDIVGATRPTGSPDIGAYQYGASAGTWSWY